MNPTETEHRVVAVSRNASRGPNLRMSRRGSVRSCTRTDVRTLVRTYIHRKQWGKRYYVEKGGHEDGTADANKP